MTRGFGPPSGGRSSGSTDSATRLPPTVEDVLHRWCDQDERLRLHFGRGGMDDMAVHHRAGYLTARGVFAVNEKGEAVEAAEFYLRPQSNSPYQPSRYLDVKRIIRIRFARVPDPDSLQDMHTWGFNLQGDLYRHPAYDIQKDIAYRMIEKDRFRFIKEFGQVVYDVLMLERETRQQLLNTREKVRRIGEDRDNPFT